MPPSGFAFIWLGIFDWQVEVGFLSHPGQLNGSRMTHCCLLVDCRNFEETENRPWAFKRTKSQVELNVSYFCHVTVCLEKVLDVKKKKACSARNFFVIFYFCTKHFFKLTQNSMCCLNYMDFS